MNSTRNPGRFAGFLYVLASIPGAVSLIYIPNKLIVSGDAAATAHNIVASETLFRLGIACNVITQILFMWVAVALYDLFKGVNRRQAVLMVGLIAIPLPIVLMNEMNAIAALFLVHGADFLSVFSAAQQNALAMLFLHVHGETFVIAEIFWGLWLFPLGLLVYRSGFVPRVLGVLLVAKCFYFLAISLVSLLVPQYESIVHRWTTPLHFGELVFMFWLLIIGARPRPSADRALSAPVVG
jgi:hypothetical protein